MNNTFSALVFAMALLSAEEACAKRAQVYIYKESPPVAAQQPADVALVAVPPVAVMFDLIRRTSCDPKIAVSTGPGDPGFDPAGPKTGNFLIPAIYRSECQPVPTPQKRRRGK